MVVLVLSTLVLPSFLSLFPLRFKKKAKSLLVFLYIYSFFHYLFIWLCQVLGAARELFSCGMQDLVL